MYHDRIDVQNKRATNKLDPVILPRHEQDNSHLNLPIEIVKHEEALAHSVSSLLGSFISTTVDDLLEASSQDCFRLLASLK